MKVLFQDMEARRNILYWKGIEKLEIQAARFSFVLEPNGECLEFSLVKPFAAKIFRLSLSSGHISLELGREDTIEAATCTACRGFIKKHDELIGGGFVYTLLDEEGCPLGWPNFQGDMRWGDLLINLSPPEAEHQKYLRLAVYYSEGSAKRFLVISYFGYPRNIAEYFLAISIGALERLIPSLLYFVPEPLEEPDEKLSPEFLH